MSYALESATEVSRLEKQSEVESYDFRKELSRLDGIDLNGKLVCDAGCGSGIVSRYIAGRYPEARVVACDASELRIQQSKRLLQTQSQGLRNLSFQVQDVKKMTFESDSVDFLFSRFVVEHFSKTDRNRVLSEFFRCVKPGGSICLIDVDGLYLNIYPTDRRISNGLKKLQAERSVDLFVGRKLPHLLRRAGFQEVLWDVQTLSFSGQALTQERELIAERFQGAAHFFTRVLGSSRAFQDFKDGYLDLLAEPETTLFYTKWVAWARKPET